MTFSHIFTISPTKKPYNLPRGARADSAHRPTGRPHFYSPAQKSKKGTLQSLAAFLFCSLFSLSGTGLVLFRSADRADPGASAAGNAAACLKDCGSLAKCLVDGIKVLSALLRRSRGWHFANGAQQRSTV